MPLHVESHHGYIFIGYDLNKVGQDYTKLIAQIKQLASGGYWHCLDSTWIVVTALTDVQVRDALLPLLDANDEILVINISGQPAAWSGFKSDCHT